MSRPDLNTIRSQYQVADDTLINYHPRVFGAVDIPFTDPVRMTKTEGALLDELTWQRGLVGLSDFKDTAKRAFSEAEKRFPDNPVPAGIPAAREGEWQGNDGHRDAFRHAYWNALMTQQYGEKWTRAFATAHEGIPGNTANREAMDLYNNEVGRSIGAANRNATPEQLANLVEQSLTQGKLVVVDRNGNLEWSDRVVRGQHGLAPNEVIGPNLGTPGVVSPQSALTQNTPTGQPETQLAQANLPPEVERMRQDPMYTQVVAAMNAKGLEDNVMAANLYAAARRDGLTGVAGIEFGKQIAEGGGNPDRTVFVFDGTQGPQGPNHARLSENDARATPILTAANQVDAQQRDALQPGLDMDQPRKPMNMTA